MKDNEKQFESDIEQSLITNGGWQKITMQESTYDATKGLDFELLLKYIKTTQEKKWIRYTKMYQDQPERHFYRRLEQEINTNGLLHVLRNGITDRGVTFKVISFKPASSLNPETTKNYEANICTVTRQFTYSVKNRNSIDMVLSINGIPMVAMELKNQITGQSVENAKVQFMNDRNPAEPMLKFNNRVLVFFAVDLYEVVMTTKLEKRNTYWLPFNQGSNGSGNVGGKGNPENKEGYATSYLWEEVLQKDQLLDIIARFMNYEEDKKRLIFPRYHQLDVVKKLVQDVKRKGAGQNYLIQHSAGSGKSNSIAWLAYHLQSLHNYQDEAIFNSVIIVTDRTVLDAQLQKTITSFDHKTGLVETIDKKKSSKDLLNAVNDGKRIIITTLQKFPIIYQEVVLAKGARFAVIVDEAHSSQTGKSAAKLKSALGDKEEVLREWQEFDEEIEEGLLDGQDEIVQTLLSQGQHKNMSFFAFTATPKDKTLDLFGTKQASGKKLPFHIYSMRQAIEEGFILDVLQNYMTYHTAFKIAKEIPDNPDLPISQAKRAIKRYESMHPYNLSQKTAVMIELFREKTMNSINGRGKAMVVTPSRMHAVRYMQEFKKYIHANNYQDMDVLVAFSGEVLDGGETYTEESMNKNKKEEKIKESQLKEVFHSADFNILIVAEKYQTGFDEPLLHTMFVDKKLRDVKAVQTLSRLNRTMPGKTDTFILDFVNEKEDIQASFQKFYESTTLDEEINVNLIYDAKKRLHKYNVYNESDVKNLMELYAQGMTNTQDAKLLGKLSSSFKPILERYEQLDDEKQYEFRRFLRDFSKSYNFITQITRMFDKDLLEEDIFIGYLLSFLPKNELEKIDLKDKVKLEYYKLSKEWEGQIHLIAEESAEYKSIKTLKTVTKPDEKRGTLDEIIDQVNTQFGDELSSEEDKVVIKMLVDRMLKNPTPHRKKMAKNTPQMFDSMFEKEFADEMMNLMSETQSAFGKLASNQNLYNGVMRVISKEAYRSYNYN
ncbi:MAG: DEAD/DEAH box helicase family protein [Streptococcaceae bacterium]|jgi:type I restriction enzyme R subunit|nr:DEAD/DEAH box helicase family protein [Streptococcaceae bacterium]